LAGAIAAGPVWLAGQRLIHPRTHEEIRPVLEFVRDHWHPGDVLYVHYGAKYAFLYYTECKCLRLSRPHGGPLWPLRRLSGDRDQLAQAAVSLTPDLILGRHFGERRHRYVDDLNRVKGRRRVWFLYSHLSYPGEQVFIQRALLGRLESLGTRINGIDRPRAHAYLFKLHSSR
jgi:hypothetical protein